MNREKFEEEVAILFASHADTICRELCEGVRGARPSHPRLIADVKNAAYCVARSRTFREIAAAVGSTESVTRDEAASDRHIDELLDVFQRACERAVVDGDAHLGHTSNARAIARSALRLKLLIGERAVVSFLARQAERHFAALPPQTEDQRGVG